MREKFLPAALAWLAAMSMGVQAADPVPSSIILPVIEQPKTDPPKQPESGATIILEPGSVYVFMAKVPCIVLASTNPGGVVKWAMDEGPIRIKSRFADKPYEYKSREFKEKYVYSVESAKEGREELIIVPVGAKDEKECVRLIFQVGQMPQPPPGPGPAPKPDDPKPVPVSTFRVILIHESAQNLPPAQNSILYGKDVRDYLTAKTTPESGVAGWRLYDKDTDAANDQSAIAAMWKAVKPKVTTVPAMAVEVNGKVEIVPLPATAPEALSALKKYRGE